jgi:thioredoxin 2
VCDAFEGGTVQVAQEISDRVEYPCALCGAKNRIPRARLRDDPACGRCHGKVFPRAPVAVTDATWQREVVDCPIPVLVDFWAPWCGPCRVVGPTLEQVAGERAGSLKVVKLNVDENQATAGRFSVRSIPTLLLTRGPLPLDQIAGARDKAGINTWLDRFI